MKPQTSRWRYPGALAVFFVLSCGEPRTYPVKGEVIYADTGEPVRAGLTIFFESTTPPYKRSSGLVDTEGKFYTSTLRDASGSLAGEHRVRFDPGHPGAGPTGPAALAPIMHPRYAEFGTSGLTVGVRSDGENVVRILVERGPKARK
jgi:hypothetical protein